MKSLIISFAIQLLMIIRYIYTSPIHKIKKMGRTNKLKIARNGKRKKYFT